MRIVKRFCTKMAVSRNLFGELIGIQTQEITFESLINIRPRQNNRSLELQDPNLRVKVEKIVRNLFGGV